MKWLIKQGQKNIEKVEMRKTILICQLFDCRYNSSLFLIHDYSKTYPSKMCAQSVKLVKSTNLNIEKEPGLLYI